MKDNERIVENDMDKAVGGARWRPTGNDSKIPVTQCPECGETIYATYGELANGATICCAKCGLSIKSATRSQPYAEDHGNQF